MHDTSARACVCAPCVTEIARPKNAAARTFSRRVTTHASESIFQATASRNLDGFKVDRANKTNRFVSEQSSVEIRDTAIPLAGDIR